VTIKTQHAFAVAMLQGCCCFRLQKCCGWHRVCMRLSRFSPQQSL